MTAVALFTPDDAKPGCCQEAALGIPFYAPCNKPAVNVVGWKGRSDAPVRMCFACTDHNVRHRGGEIVAGTADDVHRRRRDRVAVQVWEKWTDGGAGLNGETEDETMLAVIAAADATFTAETNDLDWEAATMSHLERGGP